MKTTHNQNYRKLSKSLQNFITQKGFRIEVEHNRPVDIILTSNEKGELFHHFNKSEFYDIISTWLEEKDDVTIDNGDGTISHVLLNKSEISENDVFIYGDFVRANGGFTKVSLISGEGENEKILEGKFNFKSSDPFFKAKGIFNAIKQALRGTDLINGFADVI